MSDINALRELRPAPPPAELEAMRMAARERFIAGAAPKRAPRRWRRPVLAGGLTTAAVAAGAVAALVLTNGPGAVPGRPTTAGHSRTVVTTAWTVSEEADGTVSIYLHEYANPAGLQRALQAERGQRDRPPDPVPAANGLQQQASRPSDLQLLRH